MSTPGLLRAPSAPTAYCETLWASSISVEMSRRRTEASADLQLARELAPEVILCDIGLPDMDGYALARAMRRDPYLARTRLVALTGYAQAEDRELARQAGFDAHISKPPL